MQLSIAPAKLTAAKLVFNVRGTFDSERPPSRIKYRFLFRAADHILFLSNDMACRWEGLAGFELQHSVTYSAVDQERFHPSSLQVSSGPNVLVSGLIRPLKGQLEFIRDVAPKLAANGVTVSFAGDFEPDRDPYMAACAQAAAPLGESVRFLGYRGDIAEVMASSTVIAIPSHHEGMVRAMIEAMSCARPVVSFDVCSAREILEKQSGGAGVVVNSGDYNAMADAIIDYCCNSDRAAEAGRKGHSTAARLFAGGAVVERYERVYDRLAAATETGIA
jgi:glycosyltransferase involved in cell wall biosynthesis